MVLPDEIADAALDGDVDTVRRFLVQHPERVNDVSVSGDLALLTIAIRLIVDPETRECSPDFVRLLISSGANVNRRTRPEFGRTSCASGRSLRAVVHERKCGRARRRRAKSNCSSRGRFRTNCSGELWRSGTLAASLMPSKDNVDDACAGKAPGPVGTIELERILC